MHKDAFTLSMRGGNGGRLQSPQMYMGSFFEQINVFTLPKFMYLSHIFTLFNIQCYCLRMYCYPGNLLYIPVQCKDIPLKDTLISHA